MSKKPNKPAKTAKTETKADRAKKAAETRKANAEALGAELEAEAKELTLIVAAEKRAKDLATDSEYNVYRFNGVVAESTVTKCVEVTTRWSRLKPGEPMTIVFNSPGGSVIDGFALYDHLRELSDHHNHHITTWVRGYAASMAGILMQAGDTRYMGAEAWYMIHRAGFGVQGQTFDVEDRLEWIKRIEDRILDLFAERSGLSRKKIKRNWERKDWWLSSDQCLANGLIDGVR